MSRSYRGSAGDGGEEESDRGRPYYGWVVVFASFLVMAGFLASPMCFGLFIRPLEDEFGWTRAAVSGAMSLSVGVSGLVGVLVGRWSDKYNVGLVVAIGAVIGAGSYLLVSWADSLWRLYLCFGVGMGICAGCGYAPVIATISKWFTEKRTLAIGVALSGIILGQMVLAPVIGATIDSGGWRTGFLVLAAITLGLSVPGVVLLARKPKERGSARAESLGSSVQGPEPVPVQMGPTEGYTTREAAKTAPFWMLIVTGITMSTGFFIFVTHIVPCAEELGVSKSAAALILTLSGVGSLAGTFLSGWLAVRLSGKWALLLLFVGQAVTLVLFVSTRSAWAFYLVSMLYGFCFSASVPVRMGLTVPLFGLKSIGGILGYASFAYSVGGVFGPYVSGYVHDVAGSYTWVFVGGCVFLVLGAASIYLWGSHKQERQIAG